MLESKLRPYNHAKHESVKFGVQVTSEGKASKVSLIDREHQLCVCGCQLCRLKREVVIEITSICWTFLLERSKICQVNQCIFGK